MARVTVEDCLKHVENRFDLVLKAAKRAHDIEMGAVNPMVEEDNDKPTVIALREIAAGFDVTKPVRTAAEEEADAVHAAFNKKFTKPSLVVEDDEDDEELVIVEEEVTSNSKDVEDTEDEAADSTEEE